LTYASKVLGEFIDSEIEFVQYLLDDDNWEIEGLDSAGMPVVAPYVGTECCG